MPPKTSAGGAEKVYHTGNVVLGKLKGYPAWPGHIVDNEEAPPKVRREKPTKAKSSYLVQFFPTGDYSWLRAQDISTLGTKEIDAFLNGKGKKKADLVQAYETARDPDTWRQQKAQEAAEYEAWAQGAVAVEDNVDQLASDEEGGKKRKRKSDAGKKETAGEKKAKKAKLQDPEPTEDKAEDKPVPKKAKPASDSDSPELKQVRDWRVKLQKVFIGQKAPTSEDMTKCKEYFDAMETFDMKKEWLAETKLAKVLKRIALMKESDIPDNDQYNFRSRSSALAAKWTAQANGGGSNAPDTPQAASTAAPEEQTPAPATEAPSAPASQPAEAAPAESPAPAPAAPVVGESKPVETNGDAATAPSNDTSKSNGDSAAAVEPSTDAAPAVTSNPDTSASADNLAAAPAAR
ncbi:hypothetical protein OIO90_003425 [Microbotryomycetes sp. JL221]|nr:hypothetical protein OIO90_003425 [Microbotryomycetes sp. JL221]